VRTPNGVPESSTFFSTVSIEDKTTFPVLGNGDLWPSCWGDDDALYAANGDGWGFEFGSHRRADLIVNRVAGVSPGSLTGQAIARENDVASVWSAGHSRKPTGMACVGGQLYLAVQDLRLDFEAAPALSISRSRDKGRTWSWDRSAPMFGDSVFTTLMFLDYGRDHVNAKDGFVYGYGIDNNWRFSGRVPSPNKLYLGRVPADRVQNRNAWEFYIGTDQAGKPSWHRDIQTRQPVLEDRSLAFSDMLAKYPSWPGPMTKIAQGGVFYNSPLDRYIYTSWTRFSWEFYEAPQPWGPWRHVVSKNFGVYPWTEMKHGGYAPTASTKYLSADGKTFFVQANTFLGGVDRYGFALRRVHVEPYRAASPTNARSSASLASPHLGTTALSYSNHVGTPGVLNDRVIAHQSEDSWNGERKGEDHWGYAWPQPYNLNRVAYSTGRISRNGGWFESGAKIQVRQRHAWVDVAGLCSTPHYPGPGAAANTTYVFAFDDTWGDAVRIVGRAGGRGRYTSISELDVFFSKSLRARCRHNGQVPRKRRDTHV